MCGGVAANQNRRLIYGTRFFCPKIILWVVLVKHLLAVLRVQGRERLPWDMLASEIHVMYFKEHKKSSAGSGQSGKKHPVSRSGQSGACGNPGANRNWTQQHSSHLLFPATGCQRHNTSSSGGRTWVCHPSWWTSQQQPPRCHMAGLAPTPGSYGQLPVPWHGSLMMPAILPLISFSFSGAPSRAKQMDLVTLLISDNALN